MTDRAAGSVGEALRGSRGLLISVGLFSGVINVLALTGALYMLQVYDRVLTSRSVPTLVALSMLMFALLFANGILDLIRTRIMTRIGLRVDEELRDRVFDALQGLSLKGGGGTDALQPIRDLDRVRSFLSGIGPTALFDLPWIPVYLAVIFLLHPLMGWFAVAGAILLIMMTYTTELLSRGPTQKAARSASDRLALADAVERHAEVVRAMGLSPHLRRRWRELTHLYLGDQVQASDAIGGMGVLSRVARLLLQSGILGLGAYLVLRNEVSAGAIIAGSIVMSRALAPIETAIQHWRGFVDARQGSHRLVALFRSAGAGVRDVTVLPAPSASLSVENVSVAPPGRPKPVVMNASFRLAAGEALGIIGPSGSGKSTLARALAGVWQPTQGGAVRLDGASVDQWQPEQLGRHIGYLPQDIQLFAGTISANISRLDPSAPDEAIVAAAKDAGAHEMIVNLPEGYQTQIGFNGAGLSAGQRQRIALARALYGVPFLVVLDEPNSNLDSAGDAALSAAIKAIRERNGIAVVIAHRPAALANIDRVLALNGGQIQAFGPKEDVLRNVLTSLPVSVQPPSGGEASAVSLLQRAKQATDDHEKKT